MRQDFYTVEEVAERLKLHAKTVRQFLRDGRLRGTRMGKQYRIADDDLRAFSGEPALPRASDQVRRERHVEVSCVVHIDAISVETANRTTTHLMAAMKSRPQEDAPARLDTIYDEERARLKVIISGSNTTTRELLKLIDVLIEV